MPRASQSYASKVNNWKLMVAGYDKHKTDLSFAESDSGKLKELIVKIENLEVKQEQLKADLLKTTSEIETVFGEGEKLSASILRYAKGKYGPNSPDIKDFK
jgi:hypothetical protein